MNESTYIVGPAVDLDLSGTGVVMLNCDTMLVVGGGPSVRLARSFNIWTGVLTMEAEMTIGRDWPGMLIYEDVVWVFGGNTGPSLDSVERFHTTQKTWQIGANMLSPKAAFTPCEHRGLIYLPETSPKKKQLEVLNPVTEM